LARPFWKLNLMMDTLVLPLYAAVEANYFNVDHIRDFAKNIAYRESEPPLILVELCFCVNKDDVLTALRQYMQGIERLFDDVYAGLLFGFIYMGYKEGKITFAEFSSEIIDSADAFQVGAFNIEEIGSALAEFENSHSSEIFYHPFLHDCEAKCEIEILRIKNFQIGAVVQPI
jgi:hypothetical protein